LSGLEILTVALLVGAYVPALRGMNEIWSSVDYFSHGPLVLPVALAVAWTKREALRALPGRRDGRGALVLAFALLVYVFGLLGDQVSLQGVGLVLAVAGAVLFLRGPDWLGTLIFPVGYLVFMIPVPPEWITPTINQLRLLVSRTAVDTLHLLEGSLFVAEACSGITSMVTLIPVAVLLGYFTQTRFLPRLVLVLAVVPIAMLGNMVRVLFTVTAALQVGPERATAGAIHEAAGALVYLFGCLVLLLVDHWVRRVVHTRVPTPERA
jgi:exosortase